MIDGRLAALACALLAGAGYPCVAAEATQDTRPNQALVQSIEHREQRYVHADPDIPTTDDVSGYLSPIADKEEKRFLQALLTLFERGDYSGVRQAMRQRQQTDPGWARPSWLEQELHRAEGREAMRASAGNPDAIVALYRRYPELFSCREHYHLWALADAYRELGQSGGTAEVHRQMLASCRNVEVLLTTLDRVADAEGSRAALDYFTPLEKRGLKFPQHELDRRLIAWSVTQAVALREEGNLNEASAVLARAEPAVLRNQALDAARLVAWNYHDRNDHASAASWFGRVADWSGTEEDRLHWLRARLDLKEYTPVIAQLQSRPLQTLGARQSAADFLRGEAGRAFAAGSYAECIELLDTALTHDGPEPSDSSLLRGWAYFKRNQYRGAHDAFAAAYRSEAGLDAVEGLLHTAHQSGEWEPVLALASGGNGPLLADPAERQLARRLAARELQSFQVAIAEGRLRSASEADDVMTLLSRVSESLQGVPGYTWGSIERGIPGDLSFSIIVNQGIDWMRLPGDVMLNSYVEYRSVDNEWGAYDDDVESALGIELSRSPFHLGLEYLPGAWRSDDHAASATNVYFSWYLDWYRYLRKRRGAVTNNPLNVNAYTGATYGRLIHGVNGNDGTSIRGFVRQGVDWFTFGNDITLQSYVAYQFRFRTWDKRWYDAHGPAIGTELQRGPLAFGIDYSWEISPHGTETSEGLELYLNWYYDWDLK